MLAQSACLPPLPAMQRLSPRVIRVLGGNPGKVPYSTPPSPSPFCRGFDSRPNNSADDSQFTLQGTNTYIVGTGTSRLLVDTGQGMPVWLDTIAGLLADENITLSHVLLTHWHTDHTGGVPDLISLYPEVVGRIYKHGPEAGQRGIRDRETFAVEGATLTAVHTPGHAFDHMCFVLREENALFTGDNLLGHGTPVVEDLGLYMASLRAMQALACASAYPAHGAVIANLPATLTEQLEQKLRRERRVVASLRALRDRDRRFNAEGNAAVMLGELVVLVYGSYMDQATRESILEPVTDEILAKLEADGRVGVETASEGKKWFLIDSVS